MTAIDRASAIAATYRAIFTSAWIAQRHQVGVQDRVACCIKLGSERGLEAEHEAAHTLLSEVNEGSFAK